MTRQSQSPMPVPVSVPLADALEKMAMGSPLNADLLALAKQVRG